jgi:hypothetical protein
MPLWRVCSRGLLINFYFISFYLLLSPPIRIPWLANTRWRPEDNKRAELEACDQGAAQG